MQFYKATFTESPKHVPTNKVVDGPIVGNGDTGVVLGNFPQSLRFCISKNDFWRPLEGQGRWSSDRIFGSPCPIGILDMTLESVDFERFQVEQHLQSADIVGKFYTRKQEPIELRAWVSATENMFIIEFTSAARQKVELSLTPQTGWMSSAEMGYEGDDTLWMKRSFTDEKLAWPSEAAVYLKHICGGTSLGTLSYVQLEPGVKVIFAASICTNHETPEFAERARKRIDLLTFSDIAKLREEHESWWVKFWSKSKVEIGDELLERFYYGSQYIMACCSRNKWFPPGIFGNWITKDNPSWAGDYHVNYNYQAPWWGVFSSNHVELSEPYDMPILQYVAHGKEKARRHLGIRGVYFDVGIGPKGLQTAKEKFWGQKSNAAYVVVNMMMRYYHTYDLDYAREVSYPFMREVADFWEDYLQYEDGRYVIRGDSAMESEEEPEEVNPILSLGMVKALFPAVLEISTVLGVDEDRHAKWKHIIEKLSDFPTFDLNGKRVFRLTEIGAPWREDNTVQLQHIFPAGLIGLGSNPELVEIARNTVEAHGGWNDYNGFPTIFPVAVRVGYDAGTILDQLRRQCVSNGFPNLFIFFGGGGIECCSTVPFTINEMLMQSHERVIRLFPLWPRDKDARFKDLRAVGAFLVSAELRDSVVQNVTITSEKGIACKLENPWLHSAVSIFEHFQGRSKEIAHERLDGGCCISFGTCHGAVYTIKCKADHS
ncbi:hypothetical protein GC102_23510 [Paenibacillus sp. LMG 31460]|uniref:Glycosyl hydrolase family 95 catalytic domain-containing protein n=1 Tax=Paenibacillus germinis TaxID=2654979 RepID=A0ABX1Z774_9BACL|nr:hypothetical protein [Paenibacillus germinis]NOU88694.1 hypothetical protein [Paenibacillus germinis]